MTRDDPSHPELCHRPQQTTNSTKTSTITTLFPSNPSYNHSMRLSTTCWQPLVGAIVLVGRGSVAFVPTTTPRPSQSSSPQHLAWTVAHQSQRRDDQGTVVNNNNNNNKDWKSKLATLALSSLVVSNGILGLPSFSMAETTTTTTTTPTTKQYDGFAEYAKDNQMEQSDVGCFISKCGDQTKALFSNPRGIKGVSCLGRCKGEQSCATRCFAEFGSEALNDWLSCTIEDNECVKVPKDIDNSAEDIGYSTVVKNFDPKSLVGSWYKTDGLNPNYDLFDCQTNTFELTAKDELDMGIFFRVKRPAETGGGFWENFLTEHMVVDAANNNDNNGAAVVSASAVSQQQQDANDMKPAGRTMHTSGKTFGLKFSENWFILGESDGAKEVPPFKLVAYKGHTLQGNYEGAFVYAKEPVLPEAAKPAVREAAAKAGLDFDAFTPIDNTCPAGNALNDAQAGTGTSTTDWVDLVVGEGGVIDWISPGWRGEYKKST